MAGQVTTLRLKKVTGKEAADVLDQIRITVNKNLIPFDPEKPTVTSGIRIGTPAVTTRGMEEKHMEVIAKLIDQAIVNRDNQAELSKLRSEVEDLTSDFPIYKELNY